MNAVRGSGLSRALSSSRLVRETLQAYERWAPLYPPVPHNPLMRIEQDTMLKSWPDVQGGRALDLACGSGRYSRLLRESGAAEVISLDFCMPMLLRVSHRRRVCASMMSLPFTSAAFDTVVSGLALGHATDLGACMAEVARVLRPGGVFLYSDFHPLSAQAGLTRSFKDEHGNTCTVPHGSHSLEEQFTRAAEAGLRVERVEEPRVGYELREPFPGSESFYRDWHGLPLVLVVRASR